MRCPIMNFVRINYCHLKLKVLPVSQEMIKMIFIELRKVMIGTLTCPSTGLYRFNNFLIFAYLWHLRKIVLAI